MMKKLVPKQLGEMLIERKLITPENLTEALKIQEEKGGLLGQILVSLGFIDEVAIAQILTTQYGFPYLPLAGYEIDKDVVKRVPEQVARQFGLIAVDHVGGILTVAMANPLNKQAVEDVEMITKLKVQVFVTTTSDVNDAINRAYGK